MALSKEEKWKGLDNSAQALFQAVEALQDCWSNHPPAVQELKEIQNRLSAIEVWASKALCDAVELSGHYQGEEEANQKSVVRLQEQAAPDLSLVRFEELLFKLFREKRVVLRTKLINQGPYRPIDHADIVITGLEVADKELMAKG